MPSFRPAPALVFFFGLLLVLQYLQVSSTGHLGTAVGSVAPGDTATIRTYGIWGTMDVVRAGGESAVTVHWLRLIAQLAGTWILAGLIAHGLTAGLGLPRPGQTLASMGLAVVVLAFLGAIVTSKVYWGYAFTRPGALVEVADVQAVESVIPFRTEFGETGEVVVVLDDTVTSLAEELSRHDADPDSRLQERLLVSLDERGLLAGQLSTEVGSLPEFMPAVQGAGLLASNEKDPRSGLLVHGFAVDAVARDGRRLVLLGLVGARAVSNDHYVCYEVALEVPAGSAEATYLDGQRFFFDVAGLEGMDWRGMWLLYSIAGLALGSFLMILTLVARNFRRAPVAEGNPL